MNRGSKGFTLVEALVSAVLLAVGVVAILNGFSGVSRTQVALNDRERAISLAQQKLDELVATEEVRQSNVSGDFSEEGEPNLSWRMEAGPTGVDSLQYASVVVTRGSSDTPVASASTLWLDPPVTTETEAAAQ